MNKKNNIVFAMVLGVFALLWCLVVLVFVDRSDAAFDYWGGFAFGLVAILTPLILCFVIEFRKNRASTEIAMIPWSVSTVYLLFGVIFNGYFVWEKEGDHKIVIVVVNVLAMVAYLVIIYYLSAYAERVTDLSEKISNKAFPITQLKSEMGALIAVCPKGELRNKLLELKTKVDYSNNLSQEITYEEENRFYNQLKGIEEMIRNNAADEDIRSMISEAENIWNVRNAKLMSVR